MSKIEDALRKARSMGATRSRSPLVGTQMEPIVPSENQGETTPPVPVRVSSRDIAKMGEICLLSEATLAENRIIHPRMEDPRVGNAFRELRTKILERTGETNCSVLVCAVEENSGNSFVALNLAAAFSLAESKTALLLDCNTKNPSYDYLLPDEEAKGVTDLVASDDVHIEEIIHPVGIKRLRLIPVGTQEEHAVEYVTSWKMRDLLTEILQRYPDRYLIIDGPPATQSADARILAGMCDYVLLVVPYGRAMESQVIAAVEAIGSDNMLGVVFNDEPQVSDVNWRQLLKLK